MIHPYVFSCISSSSLPSSFPSLTVSSDATQVSTWLDPRIARHEVDEGSLCLSLFVALIPADLPPGWDRITHPQHGTFYIEFAW
jgi:hypothetical protein